jgi:hypothetical protein
MIHQNPSLGSTLGNHICLYLKDLLVGKAPEPAFIVILGHMVMVDEAQEVVGAALFPLGNTLQRLNCAFTSFDVCTSLNYQREKIMKNNNIQQTCCAAACYFTILLYT